MSTPEGIIYMKLPPSIMYKLSLIMKLKEYLNVTDSIVILDICLSGKRTASVL
jgi:hypothetical protein